MNTFMLGVESSQICPPGYIYGARFGTTGAATVGLGTASRGSWVRDSTNILDLNWTGVLTGTMPTDLDTGSEAASTFYHAFVIGDTSGTNSPKALFSLSLTSPTMPSGYDIFRRLGTVRNTSASDFMLFAQFGTGMYRRIVFREGRTILSALTNGSATTFTDIDLSSVIPPQITGVFLQVNGIFDGVEGFATFRPNGNTETSPAVKIQGGTDTTSQLAAASMEFMIETDSSQLIEYKVSSSSDKIDVYALGYVEIL